ncbi:MAG: helix-hairpin-helix domain-containing protein [Synergistaceae bacterium]|nr:helix-hairpin-helix domain-containing protein [Synergistaceae bacterium]
MYSRKIIVSVAGVILFLLAGVAAMFFTPSESPRTSREPANSAPKTPKTPEAPQAMQPASQPSSPAAWFVYVTGAVKTPGVYKLSRDSRVFQAIEAAGGFTARADKASLNLAEVLADEAHVHVAVKGAAPQPPSPENVRIPGYSPQTRNNSGLVDVNRADLQELQRINGVGPAIAQRIIDYRQTHGAFTKIEDLLKVKGIGQARLNQMRPQITISGGSSYTSGTSSRQSQPNTSSSLIDINHADSQELQRINGVGQATAQRIIEYRNSHGSFTRPEDLLNIKGIGASKLKQIRTQIVIK